MDDNGDLEFLYTLVFFTVITSFHAWNLNRGLYFSIEI